MKIFQKLILISLLFFPAYNQILRAQGLQVGYMLTPQINSISSGNSSYNNEVSRNNNQTFSAYNGLSVSYFFTKNLGMGTRLNIGKDAQLFIYEKKQNGNVIERTKHHYRFTLLKIPLQVKFKSTERGKVSFLIEGGPQFCYLIKATNKGDYGNLDYTDDYSKLNFGFQLATGIGIKISNHFMFHIMPNLEVTALSFYYTKDNLNESFPMGRSITSSCIGIQFGLTWLK